MLDKQYLHEAIEGGNTDDENKENQKMLLNSSGLSKGGAVWLTAGLIIVLLAAYSLYSGRTPWIAESPDHILAKTVILKKVRQIPISPKPIIVRKPAPAVVKMPVKEPAPTEMPQPPTPETAAKPPDSIEVEQPAQEEPAASAPIIPAKQTAESQPATGQQPAAIEQSATTSAPPEDRSQPATGQQPAAIEQSVTTSVPPEDRSQPATGQQPAAIEQSVTTSVPPEDRSQPVTGQQPTFAAAEAQTSPQSETERPPAEEPTPATSVAAIPRTAAGEIHREKWLLAQDASAYTIQIIGVSTEQSLLQFIEKNQLMQQNDLAYYETVFDGKPWFQALYGIYPTKEEARQAVDKLPENIRRAGPWIRRLAAVQYAIGK